MPQFTQEAIDRVVLANGGRAYVSAPLSPALKNALANMLVDAGFDRKDVARLTQDNLVMVYSMARSDSASTRRNAYNVATRLIEQAKADPLGLGGVSGGASQAELDALKREYEGKLTDLNNALEQMTDAFGKRTQEVNATQDKLDTALAQILQLEEELDAADTWVLHKLEVGKAGEKPVQLGVVHRKAKDLITILDCGENVYLYGPAGSGKTTGAAQAAKALGLEFYFTGKLSDEYGLLGFKNATGETVRTPFREAYEHGGLFLFDEYDGSNPNAVVAMNAALANKICSFPDGVVHMHANFKCIAAGNTTMTGGDGVYTGRQVQDGAAIDRFVFIQWDYDKALERALCPNEDWCEYVQGIRAAIADRELEHLVTPRASLSGARLLAAGMSWEDVEQAVIWKGLDRDTVEAVKATLPRNVTSAANAA